MGTTIFNIRRSDVYNEVAQTTSYTGVKMDNDEKAYKRIFTTDEDRQQLERFWNECRSDVADAIKHKLVSDADNGETYTLEIETSVSFDSALEPSMGLSLRNYFVHGITAKWFMFTNKEEAPAYSASASSLLDDFCRKAYYKRRPGIPSYYINK